MKLNYGKYKGIIISVALFILLDASVLMMNFFISFEIADDAEGVNIAGRQRMLSQRMMKSLLDVQVAIDEEGKVKAMNELGNTVALFDKTLIAFDQGGFTKGASGNEVELEAVSSDISKQAVSDAKVIWAPFKQHLNTLLKLNELNPNSDFSNQFVMAVNYGREYNLKLLKLMNTLTVDLEKVASSKADVLRIIQTVGISLAILNFFIIMFHFLRQLKESDEKIEAARQETQEILDNVNEGLFLLDENLCIGNQYSEELISILGSDSNIAGQSFHKVLQGIVSEKDLNTAQSFIQLLFDKRKKQKLLSDLNPLRKIEVHILHEDGSYTQKYLNFSFSRVVANGNIIHILVTVMDITEQILLGNQIEKMKNKNQQQMEMLSTILQCHPDMLALFLNNSYETFNKINSILKQQDKSGTHYVEKANQIFALIHNYKGEASALELTQFVDLAYGFEETIKELTAKDSLDGNDFLNLTIQLKELLEQTEVTDKLVEKLSSLSISPAKPMAEQPHNSHLLWQNYASYAQEMAGRQDKSVEVLCSGFGDYSLSAELQKQINTIAIQKLRNSVSHGIESQTDREQGQKSSTGLIKLNLLKRASGDYQLTIEDDGQGINMPRIRQVAFEKGIISSEQAETLDKKQTMSLIFHPQLSSKNKVDEDSGQGMGMYAIRESIKALGGKICINSRHGVGCSFVINFPESVESSSKAA